MSPVAETVVWAELHVVIRDSRHHETTFTVEGHVDLRPENSLMEDVLFTAKFGIRTSALVSLAHSLVFFI